MVSQTTAGLSMMASQTNAELTMMQAPPIDIDTTMTVTFARARVFHRTHPRPVSNSTTLENLCDSGVLDRIKALQYITSNRIVVHPIVRNIAESFLIFKRKHGTNTEREFYAAKVSSVDHLIARLIRDRPLAFLGSGDTTLLRNGTYIAHASALWDRVGTDDEHPYIRMEEYLTYDEIMLSSLVGVSGHTYYLNSGSRSNHGLPATSRISVQHTGIQLGLVGARFERAAQMDSLYRLTAPPSRQIGAYDWHSHFAGPTFEERYKARMRITIETLLLEAFARGAESQRRVFLHVVGLGLGVWAIDPRQPTWYVETFVACLFALSRNRVRSLGVLALAWIDVDVSTQRLVQDTARDMGVECIFTCREPSARLEGAHADMLLITTYAWDGNAYPGNEYYLGSLDGSGDPAAACSSIIAETQNPEINPGMLDRILYLDSM